jgi:hypothetical protein
MSGRIIIHIPSLLMCSSYYGLIYTEKYTYSVEVLYAVVLRTVWRLPES